MRLRIFVWTVLAVLECFSLASLGCPEPVRAWTWVPSDDEIWKYRQSWNPFSHGPILLTIPDLQPKGQLYVRPFIFSQIAEKSYGNRFTSVFDAKGGPVHLYSVQHPFLQFGYGLTDHIQLNLALSANTFWVKDTESANKGQGGPWKTNTGLGDTSLVVKYRPIVQDPDTWRPSLTFFSQLGLPTGKWFTGTERPPGGFAPLGRLPATQFGSISLTEGIEARKNLRPFRISGGVFYTYQLPGSEGGETTYTSDVINARLVFEHILDDKSGFGYNLEFASLHGVPWRLDGHALNRGQQHGFSILGVEPALQWRFGDSNWVGAAGVLFSIAGQNAPASIYPNFSIFWYWSRTGKVLMR